jgi:hypothetical protein
MNHKCEIPNCKQKSCTIGFAGRMCQEHFDIEQADIERIVAGAYETCPTCGNRYWTRDRNKK